MNDDGANDGRSRDPQLSGHIATKRPRRRRGWRDRFEAPIDWEALKPQPRTRRHSLKTIAKMKAGIAKRRKARQRAALKRNPPKRQKRTPGVGARVLGLLQGDPGGWYGRADVQRATGLSKGVTHGTLLRLLAYGQVVRTENPDWPDGQPGQCMEPQWLYQASEQPDGHQAKIAEQQDQAASLYE